MMQDLGKFLAHSNTNYLAIYKEIFFFNEIKSSLHKKILRNQSCPARLFWFYVPHGNWNARDQFSLLKIMQGFFGKDQDVHRKWWQVVLGLLKIDSKSFLTFSRTYSGWLSFWLMNSLRQGDLASLSYSFRYLKIYKLHFWHIIQEAQNSRFSKFTSKFLLTLRFVTVI